MQKPHSTKEYDSQPNKDPKEKRRRSNCTLLSHIAESGNEKKQRRLVYFHFTSSSSLFDRLYN